MQVEIDKLILSKVFTLVPEPKNHKLISCRGHLKKRLNPSGSLKKFKARLVARGFTQRKGIDYSETFDTSSRQQILNAFLAVNGHKDWEVLQIDVIGPFIYGDLDEEIYLSQPDGFVDSQTPEYVWWLNSSLYGLKKSARQWHHCFTDQSKLMGFKAAQVDPFRYRLNSGGDIVATIIVHANAILFAGTSSSIKNVEKILQAKFQLTQNKEVSQCLSFDITRDHESRTLTMKQSSYINDLIKQYKLENACSVSTPCDDSSKELCKNDHPKQTTSHSYCSLIGVLLWLYNGTRPDITFAVNRLSSFINPTETHWKSARCVLIYERDTTHHLITLGGNYLTLSGHSDSDWAEQQEDHLSTTGIIFRVGCSLVSWKSLRQPTIALSSTEAKYMATTDTS